MTWSHDWPKKQDQKEGVAQNLKESWGVSNIRVPYKNEGVKNLLPTMSTLIM